MAATLKGIRQGYPKAKFSLSKRSYTVQWDVVSDSYADGPLTAQSASGLPVAFSVYSFGGETDLLARLREWDAYRLDDNSLDWIVEATYSTPEMKSGENRGTGQGTHTDTAGAESNPLLELPIVKTSIIEKEVPITRIYNLYTNTFTVPMNSACEVFNPPAMRKKIGLQLSITRNEALSANHPALGIQYSTAVNADSLWGMNPGIWMCRSINPQRETKQIQGGTTYAYFRVAYSFEAHSEGWDVWVLDAGNYYCEGGAGAIGGNPLSWNSGTTYVIGSEISWLGTIWQSLSNGNIGHTPGDDAGAFWLDTGIPLVQPSGSGYGSGTPSPNCPTCTKKVGFIDDKGHPIKGLLDGHGNKLAQNLDPVYFQIRPYRWLSFGALSLPTSFSGVQ